MENNSEVAVSEPITDKSAIIEHLIDGESGHDWAAGTNRPDDLRDMIRKELGGMSDEEVLKIHNDEHAQNGGVGPAVSIEDRDLYERGGQGDPSVTPEQLAANVLIPRLHHKHGSVTEREAMDNEFNEEELEILKKEAQVTDNPFSGFGRPFSNDNPMMSEQYFQDNPVSATGPYSGPSSYSINTVAPYNTPHEGEENPSQNVGPYAPPGATLVPPTPSFNSEGFEPTDPSIPVGVGEGNPLQVQSAYREWDEASGWYDGTPEAIYNRIVSGERILKAAKVNGEVEVEDILGEQLDVLRKVANEISDANLNDYLEEVPGGTVAMEYDDLTHGGLVDVNSFLHTSAAQLIKEVNATDWDAFATHGANQWISKKLDDNPGLLQHETMTRKAAVDYAKDKTMVLMDPVRRAEIIDTFVTNTERFRREAANALHKSLEEEAAFEAHREAIRQREAKMQVEADLGVDEFFPGAYTDQGPDFTDDGAINIGIDDGTLLYEAALQSTQTFDKNWPEFTTAGAKEWFSDKVTKNAGILKSPDTTYRASADYARGVTKFVKDASVRNEIVRAFTESVEFLRDQYENKRVASAQPEYNEFDEIYGAEDEILW